MITINISTQRLFINFMTSLMDISWDNKNDEKLNAGALNKLNSLLAQDISAIRQLFKDGYTPMLVGGDNMSKIDPFPSPIQNEVEIRIYDDDDKLIGVIIDPELVY